MKGIPRAFSSQNGIKLPEKLKGRAGSRPELLCLLLKTILTGICRTRAAD
jgi:hypothetical protein